MGKNICNKKNPEGKTELGFINYSKSLVKTFMLITVVFLCFGLKNMVIGGSEGPSAFACALFIIAMTVLFSIVSVVDQYIYNNIVLGIGIAVGLSFMDLNSLTFGGGGGGGGGGGVAGSPV